MNRVVWGWSLGVNGYMKRFGFLVDIEENGDRYDGFYFCGL